MAISIGEAVIKLGFDSKSLEQSATQVKSKVSSALGTMGSIAKVGGKAIAAGLSVAASAVSALAAGSIKAYADYEQLVGGVETLYDKSADKLLKYAKQSYKTAQINANAYMETAIGFSASLVQSLGGDTEKAADLANQAIIDMADNANKMGTDISRLQDAYRGFARQQFNMLDNLALGYGGTRNEMERLLADAEKITGIHYDISNFADITEAIHVIQTEMKIAGTSAYEAGMTIQGSLKMTKAALADLVVALTDPNADLGTAVENLITSIVGDDSGTNKGLVGNLVPAAERALKGIATVVEKGLPTIVKQLPDMLKNTLPDIAKAAVAIVVAITDVIPELAPVIADALSFLTEELVPYIPQILGSLMKGLALYLAASWKTMFERYAELLAPIINWIKTTISNIINWIAGVITPIIEFFKNIVTTAVAILAPIFEKIHNGIIVPVAMAITQAIETIKTALGAIVGWLNANIIQPIASFFSGLWNGIKSGVDALVGGIKQVFSTIGNVLKAPINAIIDAINKVIDSINSLTVPDWVPGIGGQHPNFGKIPRLAEGGIATKATNAVIGEAGKEAVIPLEQNTGNWAGLLARTLADEFQEQGIGGTGITVYMTNNINNNLDADEIGQRLMTSIRRAA